MMGENVLIRHGDMMERQSMVSVIPAEAGIQRGLDAGSSPA
jgi:hypothetical protein